MSLMQSVRTVVAVLMLSLFILPTRSEASCGCATAGLCYCSESACAGSCIGQACSSTTAYVAITSCLGCDYSWGIEYQCIVYDSDPVCNYIYCCTYDWVDCS
jgi:hypothetical protein